MFEAKLLAVYCTDYVRNATSSIVACAEGIFSAATSSWCGAIFLWVIAGTKGVDDCFSKIHRTGANGFARDQIEFFQNDYMCADTSATFLQTIFRDQYYQFDCNGLASFAGRLTSY